MGHPGRLVVQLESPNKGQQGDSLYRTVQPCRAMGELPGVHVVSGCWLSAELHALAEQADGLVLCDAVDLDLAALVHRRKLAGKPTVYEINDHFLAPQPWSPTAYLAKDPLTRSLSSLLAHECSLLQFTSEELRRRFGHLNARTAVFPNHLWTVPPFRERGDGAVRLGFGGSLGHLEDLQWIAPTVRDALARHPSAVMCVMGAPEFQQFFRSLPPEQFQYTPGGSLEDYLRFVASLDVGLCPNLSTDFNACRSDIKWAEYSAHGVATVCSDIPPYADVRHGETGLRFADLPGLAACLDQVLTDAPLRRGLARRAWELVASQRVERAHASERLTAWGLTVPDEGVPWPERATLERRRGGVRTFDGSNSIHLAFGPLEEKLYQGLTRARDRVDAVEAFTAAKRLGPDFYLPWLYLGNAESDARRAEELLRRACALAPMAYAPSFLRGLRLRQLGREDEAKAELERCRTLAPSVGAAQGALGELALANGDVDGAIACFEDAFAHNPWRPIAGLQAASAQLDRGRPARTVELVEACLQHDVPQGPEALLLGRAYFALGRFQDARRQLEQVLASTTEPVPVLALLAKAHLALGNQRMADVLLGELKRLVGDGPKR